MSQKREKEVRRALRMYGDVVRDVGTLKCAAGDTERRLRRVEEDREEWLGLLMRTDCVLRQELRKESRKRRKAGRAGAWALGLAIAEGLGLAALAAVVLL